MMHIYDTTRKIEECSSCGKWFIPGHLDCGVTHYGKGCCHYGDIELERNA